MESLFDYILSEVSIDQRVTDGIFNMENNNHMDVLYEYFVNHGLSEIESLKITNGMVEGKFPDRQAFSINSGRTTTFSSKEKRDAAIKSGTHTLKEPAKPKVTEPSEKPLSIPSKNEPNDEEPQQPKHEPNIFQNGHQLAVEPIGGKSQDIDVDKPSVTPNQPQTPNQVAATKQVVKQIIGGDNTTLSNLVPPLNLKEELSILLKEANRLNLKEAVTFLIDHL